MPTISGKFRPYSRNVTEKWNFHRNVTDKWTFMQYMLVHVLREHTPYSFPLSASRRKVCVSGVCPIFASTESGRRPVRNLADRDAKFKTGTGI